MPDGHRPRSSLRFRAALFAVVVGLFVGCGGDGGGDPMVPEGTTELETATVATIVDGNVTPAVGPLTVLVQRARRIPAGGSCTPVDGYCFSGSVCAEGTAAIFEDCDPGNGRPITGSLAIVPDEPATSGAIAFDLVAGETIVVGSIAYVLEAGGCIAFDYDGLETSAPVYVSTFAGGITLCDGGGLPTGSLQVDARAGVAEAYRLRIDYDGSETASVTATDLTDGEHLECSVDWLAGEADCD